jgi:hypothetical protein
MENKTLALTQDANQSPYFVYFEYKAMPFKCLSKVCNANFITVTMMVDEYGIFIQENTANRSVVFETFLQRQKFDRWLSPIFEEKGSVVCLGFNAKDFMQQLDSVVKTDTFKMYVLVANTNVLHIEVIKKGDTGRSHKYIALCKTEIGNLVSTSYKEHMPTVSVSGTRFSQVGTAATKQSKHNIRIRAQEGGISIESVTSEIKGFQEVLGTWVEGKPILFDEMLSTARFVSFGWMGKVTENIRIYACPGGLPLKLTADVGGLGTSSLYLQPEAQAAPPIQESFQTNLQIGY